MSVGSLCVGVGLRCLRGLWQALTALGMTMCSMPSPDWQGWYLPLPTAPDALDPTGRPVWFERPGAAWVPNTDQQPMDEGTRP